MRRLSLVSLVLLAACSTNRAPQYLLDQGWTVHTFAGTEREWFQYICDPRDAAPEARAAIAHQRLEADVVALSERSADDYTAGRINEVEFGMRIQREVVALAAEIHEDTGCLLVETAEPRA